MRRYNGGRSREGGVEKGKFYPKLVLTASDGSGAQCFTYEAYQADSKKAAREIKRQVIALAKKQS